MDNLPITTKKHNLKSGNSLEIWPAKWEDALNLMQVVSKEISTLDLVKGTVEGLSLQMISSKPLMSALWPCMGLCVYKSTEKISEQTFTSMEGRKDFIEIVKEVLVFNITPFSENVALLCEAMFKKDLAILSTK